MTYQLLWILLLSILAQFGPVAIRHVGQSNYVVTGRVVDERGDPIPHATVVLEPAGPQETWESMVNYYQTNDRGEFRIEEESPLPTLEKVLYVTTTFPPDTYAPISPPFEQLSSSDSSFAGRRVSMTKDQKLDLGNVTVQVRYGVVLIRLQDENSALLLGRLGREAPLPDVNLRIRDRRGDVIDTAVVPHQGVHRADSAIALALPEGRWQVEIMCKSGDTTLYGASGTIALLEPRTSLDMTLGLRPAKAWSEVVPETPAAISQGSPRHELERSGISFTAAAFVERAQKSNFSAIKLFLAAGMNPDARGKNGETALMAAARSGDRDIVRLLLGGGAEVNATADDGATALIIAAGCDDDILVRMLLARSVNVNAKTNIGMTALMLAVGNNRLKSVRMLLAAGADVNAKAKNGETALMLAEEFGRDEIAGLLRQHPGKR